MCTETLISYNESISPDLLYTSNPWPSPPCAAWPDRSAVRLSNLLISPHGSILTNDYLNIFTCCKSHTHIYIYIIYIYKNTIWCSYAQYILYRLITDQLFCGRIFRMYHLSRPSAKHLWPIQFHHTRIISLCQCGSRFSRVVLKEI